MDKENPKISVIMPNYNHAQYISDALDAILKQSIKPYELIIVDDASADNSIEVINAYARHDSTIKVYRNEVNRGAAFSTKLGFNLASGDYIYLPASDDKISPGLFENLLNLFNKYPQAGLCCSDASYLTEDGVLCKTKFWKSKNPCYISPSELSKITYKREFGKICTQTSLIKKAAMIDVGGINPELEWQYDWVILYGISFRYGICYYPGHYSILRVSNSSWSSIGSKNRRKQSKINMSILELLHSPRYKDILPYIQKSCVLASLRTNVLSLLIFNSKNWKFLSFRLIARLIFEKSKEMLSSVTPYKIKYLSRKIRFGTDNV